MSPPLIMIHGAFAGGWSFAPMCAYFEARGFRCLTPDLRHHGADAKHGAGTALATTSMRDYADDICQLIDAQDAPPLVIGHSMGGLLAQMLATRRKLAGAVLLAPSAPWGVLASSVLEMVGATSLLMNGTPWEQPVYPIYHVAAEYTFDRLPIHERQAAFARLGPESGRACFEILHWPLDPQRATFVFPREVTCPLLTLVGSRDSVNPPETVRRVARRYRRASEFQVLRGMSHWLIAEPGWEDVAARIEEWIGALGRADASKHF